MTDPRGGTGECTHTKIPAAGAPNGVLAQWPVIF